MANESKQQKQADWAQTDSTAVDYIKNKPEIPEEQIQADWNQSKISAKDYIKNKPYISGGLPTVSEDNNGQVLRVVNGSWGMAQLSLLSKSITENGSYAASDENADGYSEVVINVPNTYTSSDEGKVVSNGDLVSQTSKNVTANGTVDTTLNNQVVVDVTPNVGSKTITENGTYNASSDNYDGYSQIIVDVAGGGAAEPVLTIKTIYENGTYTASNDGADGYSQVNADVHVGIIEPYVYDLAGYGYVNNGTWNVAGGSISCTDIYEVESGNMYLILLGSTVGSRFRAMFSTTDTSTASSDISGTSIINQNNPQQYAYAIYKPTSDGYLTITKDNAGVTGLKTFVFSVPDLIDGNSSIDHSGDGSQVVLKILTATANGTYSASSDNADGYSSVTVNVPNSYTSSDEGKVVSNGDLVSQTSKNVTVNGTVDTTLNNQVVVNVAPNVGFKTITENGTYNASSDNYDGYSNVTVDVPNTYTSSDEGKVVSNGGLVSQTSKNVTANGTVDTTLNNQVVVNVAPNVGSKTITENGTYDASSDNYDGYSQIIVNVAGEGESSGEDEEIARSIVERTIILYSNSKVQIIGEYAFYSCSLLSSVSIPACTVISGHAFRFCSSLSSVNFPVCSTIGNYAFAYCSALSSVSIPACTAIAAYAFAYCRALSSTNFPVCSTIGNYAFYYCSSLSSVNFQACTAIAAYAFGYCRALSSVNFQVCSTIGNYAFAYCSALSYANFPVCSTIGNNAFSNCYKLLSLHILLSSVCVLANSNAFNSTPIAGYTTNTEGVYGSIYVPASLLSDYKAANNWSYFSSRFVGI